MSRIFRAIAVVFGLVGSTLVATPAFAVTQHVIYLDGSVTVHDHNWNPCLDYRYDDLNPHFGPFQRSLNYVGQSFTVTFSKACYDDSTAITITATLQADDTVRFLETTYTYRRSVRTSVQNSMVLGKYQSTWWHFWGRGGDTCHVDANIQITDSY